MHSVPLPYFDQHTPPRTTTRRHILVLRREEVCTHPDWLAVEEPLEIRVQGPGQDMVRVAVTMRTPGHDQELAVGFLYTEGLIRSRAEILAISADGSGQGAFPCNVVTIRLTHAFDPTPLQRHFYATSSCGICGKASLEQIAVHCTPVAPGPVVTRSVLVDLPTTLRSAQPVFEQTGGLHAAGVFDVTGRLLLLREDVGRHNAVDKLVGQRVLAGHVPLANQILVVSGRTSFEIMQKAAMAQVPIVCGVSAPSSLAVEVAHQFGITLVGFLRQQGCNVYTHAERIALQGEP
jgi:FdhD protein